MKSGVNRGARGADDVVARLSGAVRVGGALGAALGVVGWWRGALGGLKFTTSPSHLKVALVSRMGLLAVSCEGRGRGVNRRVFAVRVRGFLHGDREGGHLERVVSSKFCNRRDLARGDRARSRFGRSFWAFTMRHGDDENVGVNTRDSAQSARGFLHGVRQLGARD